MLVPGTAKRIFPVRCLAESDEGCKRSRSASKSGAQACWYVHCRYGGGCETDSEPCAFRSHAGSPMEICEDAMCRGST